MAKPNPTTTKLNAVIQALVAAQRPDGEPAYWVNWKPGEKESTLRFGPTVAPQAPLQEQG